MISKFTKSINIISVLCYLIFMGLAFDSKAVNAVVLYISEFNSNPVYTSGDFAVSSVEREVSMKRKPIVAMQYKVKKKSASLVEIAGNSKTKDKIQLKQNDVKVSVSSLVPSSVFNKAVSMNNMKPAIVKKIYVSSKSSTKARKLPSVLDYLAAVKKKKWSYSSVINRYIVQYDKDTYIVLTLKPSLQKRVESVFKKYKSRISAGIIQDPVSGAILAMTSSHKNKLIPVISEKYKTDNWALEATFPVASIFKIITAAAGLETKKITINSRIRSWKRSTLKVWQAFARSHNGVFGRIARKAGVSNMKKYAKAFGFNKKFFFDLPVGNAVAKFPKNKSKFAESCAGLNKNFMLSPMHVSSIVSTIINGGKTMKPYLVDYVVRGGDVVFKRKPFQMAKPVSKSTASKIYKMMHRTTTYGTAKRSFGGYKRCLTLAKMCGGKTGTLTGASPKYLYTWFGGSMKVTGRDLTIVTLMGQVGHGSKKASSVAARIAYDLYMKRVSRRKSLSASK